MKPEADLGAITDAQMSSSLFLPISPPLTTQDKSPTDQQGDGC